MENNVEVNNKKFKVGIVEIAIILEGILLGLIFITHSLWLFIPLIIVGIYCYAHKAKTKEETERRESISNQAFAFGLLIPVFLIIGFFTWLIVKLIPVIINNWQW
ncbi:MAG: hypothetical protein GY705_17740 [Bacteroidetes bacterium]|nr:hypothetical protein [Bacteroidota bacterium]